MAIESTATFEIKKVNSTSVNIATDTLAVEEPLEIRLLYGPESDRKLKSISVTMRTPGNDPELAAGFLFTEGIIKSSVEIDLNKSLADPLNNTFMLYLNEYVQPDLAKLERHFYTSSSCGVCGKSSIESVRVVTGNPGITDEISVKSEILHKLPELLRKQQEVFESTGGLHASALFSTEGELMILKEDVGRHNALDKLIGNALIAGLTPLNNYILLLSGRASFELIQKAAVAGIKIVSAVGAPSSLAVELATEFNITLIGFLRNERFNIYSGMQRVIL
jgi:FdhD protein